MIALSERVIDAGTLAAIVTAIVTAIYSVAKVSRDVTHSVRMIAEIPERFERLERNQDAFAVRLDQHLIDEEAAINGLRAELAITNERRSELRA
jgi:hypothetical protein